jgi:hypothetical protein
VVDVGDDAEVTYMVELQTANSLTRRICDSRGTI